ISFGIDNQELSREDGYDSLNMSFQGNWALGTPKDVVSSITGDTVFIIAGGGVVITDISNPASPQVISEVYARALVDFLYFDTETKYLYLAAYFSGFEIWDLSDITSPIRLSRTPTEALPRGGIYAYEEYLYVITYSSGMNVYDVSDPVHPEYLSTTNVSGYAGGYFAENNFLYVVTNNAIRLYDVSFPSVPVLRSSYPCTPRGILVSDGYGYIADQSGLKIIDVSDPDNLTLVGSIAISGACYDVAVIDDFAYVANNWYGGTEGGVYAIDVNDPENPVQTNFYNSYFNAVTGVSNSITCTNSEGYTIFDVSTPGELVYLQQTGLPGFLMDVAVKDDFAYTGSNGIRVFDITDHSQPQQLAYMESSARLIDISGDLAACVPESMSSGNRLNMLDISDPVNFYEIGHYDNLMLTQEAIIHGDYVYIAGWWDGVTILNISDPSSPSFVKKVHNWTNGAIPGEEFCYASDISVQGNYLYIIDYKPFEADDTKGLYIYDISDPENPVFVSRYEQQSEKGWRIKVEDAYAYLADGNGGIEVIDISNPAAPQTVAYLGLMDVAYNLDVNNGYVYAACYILGGVQAIDISDPENPSVVGYYYRSGLFALNVTADGHDIFIADGIAGFQIYSHDVIFTGLEDLLPDNNNVAVFPNPTDGITNLELEAETEVLLFDQTGRFIEQINVTIGSNKIDLSNQPNGIYYLKLKLNSQIVVKKIVVANHAD
nr:T9SS type A sorting domain-containing protein [Bacteroidota bacterium]